jgi:hypothetical protein
VSIDENFFDLGGHSLLLLQMHAALQETLRARLDKDLQIVTLLAYPSIRSLAAHLDPEAPAAAPREQFRDRAQRQKEALAHMRRPSLNRPPLNRKP